VTHNSECTVCDRVPDCQLDEALDRLADLERLITAIGGYMTAPQQFDLSCARELLKHHGRRK